MGTAPKSGVEVNAMRNTLSGAVLFSACAIRTGELFVSTAYCDLVSCEAGMAHTVPARKLTLMTTTAILTRFMAGSFRDLTKLLGSLFYFSIVSLQVFVELNFLNDIRG